MKPDPDEVTELRRRGWTAREIADLLRVSIRQVYEAVQQHNDRMRPRHGR